jgi:hypothetical protein
MFPRQGKLCYHQVVYPAPDPRSRLRLALEYLPQKERGIEDCFYLVFIVFYDSHFIKVRLSFHHELGGG